MEHADKLFDVLGLLSAAHVRLPFPPSRIVVVGSKSCGKTSLLQTVANVQTPIDPRLSTTYTSIEVQIQDLPESTSPASTYLREATRLRGTSTDKVQPTEHQHDKANTQTAATKDGSRPATSYLTFVDTPGLISSALSSQSSSQLEMIRKAVCAEARREEAIILAIVSAETEPENQSVLDLVKEADPAGLRTIPIITKPDKRNGEPMAQANIISWALNEKRFFPLGWHVVKNANSDVYCESCVAGEDAVDEADFFSQRPWNRLSRVWTGSEALRRRIRYYVGLYFVSRVSKLTQKIERQLTSSGQILHNLGVARDTPEAQRAYLSLIAKRLHSLISENVNQSRLEDVNPKDRHDSLLLRNHLWTAIQLLNLALKTSAPKWNVKCRHECFGLPEKDCSAALTEATNLCQSLCQKLPIPFTPTPTGQATSIGCTEPAQDIFTALPEPWEHIIRKHLLLAFRLVKHFLLSTMKDLCDGHTYTLLQRHLLEPGLAHMKRRLQTKTRGLLKAYKNPLRLWTPSAMSAMNYPEHTVADSATTHASTSPPSARNKDATKRCHQAHAYRAATLSSILDTITIFAIDACLLSHLRNILTPSHVAAMSDATLSLLGSEAPEVIEKRNLHKHRQAELAKALDLCHELEARDAAGHRHPGMSRSRSSSHVRSRSTGARPRTPVSGAFNRLPALTPPSNSSLSPPPPTLVTPQSRPPSFLIPTEVKHRRSASAYDTFGQSLLVPVVKFEHTSISDDPDALHFDADKEEL